MRALVVFESMFGNTEAIAREVAEGLAAHADVTVVDVAEAPTNVGADVEVLVVGAPTHAFSLSRPATRRDAAGRSAVPAVSSGIGLREWLAGLDPGAGTLCAAFDTRVRRPRLPGSAARAAARRLRRFGLRLVTPAASFYVDGTMGPLLDGELERARRWGEMLADRAKPATTTAARSPRRSTP